MAGAGNLSMESDSIKRATERLNSLQAQDTQLNSAQRLTMEANPGYQTLLRNSTGNPTDFLTYQESGYKGSFNEYYTKLFGTRQGDGTRKGASFDQQAYMRDDQGSGDVKRSNFVSVDPKTGERKLNRDAYEAAKREEMSQNVFQSVGNKVEEAYGRQIDTSQRIAQRVKRWYKKW